MDLHLVIAGGLFSLGGVLLGGLLTPLTQLFLERKRKRRVADRAKLLVAAELLHAQMTLRSVSKGKLWPPIEDLNAFLPDFLMARESIQSRRQRERRLMGSNCHGLWAA